MGNLAQKTPNLDQASDVRVSNCHPSELDCMRRLSGGDEVAMQELIQTHGQMLAEFVGRLTAWHSDQEDILQQVLVCVWEKAGSFRGDGSLEGWLKRIAVHRSRNHFRASNQFKRMLQQWAGDRPHHASNRSVEMIAINEELQNALTQLSADDRAVIVLYYLDEQPPDQIADWMNITIPALHQRLSRARKKLSTFLVQEHFHEK